MCGHERNAPDDVLARLADNGGVIMITFVSRYISDEARLHREKEDKVRDEMAKKHADDEQALQTAIEAWREANPAPKATLGQVADHIDHVREIAGIDHIGLGGDFDGVTDLPVGLEDVSKYPHLLVELLRRGYSDEEVKKIAGLNVLRVMRKVEILADQLQKTEKARDMTIEEVDGLEEQASE